jgi:AcrR family transcriptional regulator
MPSHGSRLPKSEATRIRLLECAIQEIVDAGPDRVGFTAIARRAQMSTGALYARYENADELLIDVWLHSCLPVLRTLVEEMVEAVREPSGQAGLALTARINTLDPVLVAAVRILAVARRNDTIREVVEPSFLETLARGTREIPALPFLAAHVFGYVLGISGTGLVHLDWYGPLSVAAALVRRAEAAAVDTTGSFWAETPVEPVGDEIDQRLFAAVSDVIGQVGVDRATVSRIARKAQVNPASIYMRYEDKDALVVRTVTLIAEMSVERNREIVGTVSGMEQVSRGIEMFRGNASDEYASVRRLRLETMVAAGSHEEIREVVRRTYVEAAGHDAEAMGFRALMDDPGILPFALFMRFMFFGHALLREYGHLGPENEYTASVFAGLRKLMNRMMTDAPSGSPAAN